MSKDKIVLNIIDGYKEGDALAISNGMWDSEARTLTIEVQQEESVENILENVELISTDSGSKFLSVTYQTSDATFDLEEYHASTTSGLQKADAIDIESISVNEDDNIDINSMLSVASLEENNAEVVEDIPFKEEVLSVEESTTNIDLANSEYIANLQHEGLAGTLQNIDNVHFFEDGFNDIATTTDLSSFFEIDALSIKIKETT